MATTTKKQRDEIVEVLEQYLAENGPRVEQIIAESRARNQAEQMRLDNEARIAREEEWYGKPEPDVDRRPRVVAVKSFTHRGNEVPIGSVWLASHEAVQSAPSAFAPVVED